VKSTEWSGAVLRDFRHCVCGRRHATTYQQCLPLPPVGVPALVNHLIFAHIQPSVRTPDEESVPAQGYALNRHHPPIPERTNPGQQPSVSG
jgi:hypothetical protein